MATKKHTRTNHLKKPAVLLIIGLSIMAVFWLSFVSITTKTTNNSQAATNTPTKYVPGRIVIKVKSGYTPSQSTVRTLTGWTDATVKRIHKDIYLIKSAQLTTKFYSLSSTAKSAATATSPDSYTQSTITKLKSNSDFLIAETDLIGRYDAVPNDEYYIAQKPYLDNLGFEQTWDKTQNGKEVIIGVLDSGISAPGTTNVNPELANRMWVNTAEKNGTTGVDDDNNGFKDDIFGYKEDTVDSADNITHGTHVAGIIAAEYNNGKEIAGLCPTCKIMSLKSANVDNLASFSNVLAAIDYAIKQKSKGINIVAINHSYGFAQSGFDTDTLTLFKQLFVDAKAAGIISITSAGNQHLVTAQYPALFTAEDLVFTVVATTRDGLLTGYSNYGSRDSQVDFAAPGTDNGANGIISLRNTTGSIRLEGTSMAAPHVTGLIGLMLSLKTDLTYSQVKAILSSTTDNVDAVQLDIYKGQLGFGRIHAGRAINKLIQDYGIIQTPSPTPTSLPTATPTSTPTPIACTAPAAPKITTPAANGSLSATPYTITWTDTTTNGNVKYKIFVRPADSSYPSTDILANTYVSKIPGQTTYTYPVDFSGKAGRTYYITVQGVNNCNSAADAGARIMTIIP